MNEQPMRKAFPFVVLRIISLVTTFLVVYLAPGFVPPLDSADLPSGAVIAETIADSAIITAKLADGSVFSSKILDG